MEYPINLTDGQLISGMESMEPLNRIDETSINGISTFALEFEDDIQVKIEAGILLCEGDPTEDDFYEDEGYYEDEVEPLNEYEMISEYDLDISFFDYNTSSTRDLIEFLIIETIEITNYRFGVTISSYETPFAEIIIEVVRYGMEISFNLSWVGSNVVVSTQNLQHIMAAIMGPINKKRKKW